MKKLQQHAVELLDFAEEHPGLYHESISKAEWYKSSGFEDELMWGMVWKYRATGSKEAFDKVCLPLLPVKLKKSSAIVLSPQRNKVLKPLAFAQNKAFL